MSSLFFIALTTPAVELFSVMRDLRLPKEFVDLSMLIYRYIFVLIGEAIAMHNAQVMRTDTRGSDDPSMHFQCSVQCSLSRLGEGRSAAGCNGCTVL